MRKFFLFICIPFYWKGHKKVSQSNLFARATINCDNNSFLFFLGIKSGDENKRQIRESPLMTSDIRVGRGGLRWDIIE